MTTERLPLPLLMRNVVRPVIDRIFHADPEHVPVHFMVLAIEVGQPLTTGQFATNMTGEQFARVADYVHQMAAVIVRNQALEPLAPPAPVPAPHAANADDPLR